MAVVLAGFVLLLACSRQEEGDRCDTKNDDNDCESGLICVSHDLLRGGSDDVDRCCNPEGTNVNDGRCTRLIGGGTSTTSTSTSGGGGQAGANGGTTAGDKCTHTSQCPDGMVCGPTGLCQAECLEDRDCDEGLVCEAGSCVDR